MCFKNVVKVNSNQRFDSNWETKVPQTIQKESHNEISGSY